MVSMSAVVFDGKQLAREREELLRQRILNLGKQLKLVSVYFNEDKTGQLYTRLKGEAAQRVGIGFEKVECAFGDDMELLKKRIKEVCERTDVTGMLIQKPPKKMYHQELWEQLVVAIDPDKDADGLSPERKVLPATVKAVMTILQGVPLRGKRVVVVGRSEIVGSPLARELVKMGMEVQNVGSGEVDLGAVTKQADILVSATGREKLITADMVKEGAVVIDVGEPKPDVDFELVKEKASFITPVPGGVGPMTVVSLLENVVELGQ